MTVIDGEHSLKVKPTNLEKKTQNGESKKKVYNHCKFFKTKLNLRVEP